MPNAQKLVIKFFLQLKIIIESRDDSAVAIKVSIRKEDGMKCDLYGITQLLPDVS